MVDRSNLPFRQTVDCFLLCDDNKILAQKVDNKFIVFPGGGIDDGESIKKGAQREILEETGAIVYDLKEVGSVKYLWWYELMNDVPKRIERWKKYQGEEVHFLIGKVKEFKKPTSDENDDWKGNMKMSVKQAISYVKKYSVDSHKNIKPYKDAQLTIMNTIFYFL